jgi:hypothetical protein
MVRKGDHKKRNSALISKMFRSLEFNKREKFLYRKTEFLKKFFSTLIRDGAFLEVKRSNKIPVETVQYFKKHFL